MVENLGELSVSGIDINMDSLITGISHGKYQKDGSSRKSASGASMSKYDVEIKPRLRPLDKKLEELTKRLAKKMSF